MKKQKSKLAITFIEVPSTINGMLYGPQSRDVYSFYKLPSRACDLLQAIARKAGFPDTVSLTPALQKKGVLSQADWARIKASDVVGLSVITRTAPPTYELAALVRAVNPEATIILGGPHVTALPEEGLAHGDVVIMGEGDHTIAEVLQRIDDNPAAPHLADVHGIAYRDGDEMVVTPRRPFLKQPELDALPFPVFTRQVRKRITHQTVVTSRGCPYGCEYCSVIQNFGRGYRCLSEDRTVELLRHHLEQTRASIFFSDDNFTANRNRVKSLLTRCLSEGLDLPLWSCQSRVEAAFDDDLLNLMVRTNLNQVMIGFESVNNETLKLWNKSSSYEKNLEAIRRFQAKGITIHGMFVFGSDADTMETIDQTIAFAKSVRLDTAQFFALTPLPGTPMTDKLEAEGRVLTRSWHLYDGQQALIQPAKMTPTELQNGVVRAFRQFYHPVQAAKRLFIKAPHRIQMSLIRLLGRRLINRVVRENLPHARALDDLNDWLKKVDDICSATKHGLKDFFARTEGVRTGIAESVARRRDELLDGKKKLLQSLEDRIASLRQHFDHLAESYHPFCQRLLEEVRHRLRNEVETAAATV